MSNTTSKNGQRYDTLPIKKITIKIIADFADWVRVRGAFAIGFLTPITIYFWVMAIIGLVGRAL